MPRVTTPLCFPRLLPIRASLSLARPGNKMVIPSDLRGFVFSVITKDGGVVDDSTTVAGLAILNFAYDSGGQTL
jgi:hypothetical protein